MPYFIKQTKKKNDMYFQIYESHYDKEKGYSVHSSYKVLGYLSELNEKGISDPKEYFQEEVNQLNLKEKEEKRQNRFATIRDFDLKKYVGYFPAKAMLGKLGIKKHIDMLALNTGFQFDLYDMLSALIFSRLVEPCSKKASFEKVLPNLYSGYRFSYDQVLDACEYFGAQYEKLVEIFTLAIRNRYGINTSSVYFDCTNFYFEIDSEDAFRRKGPSKENRKDPIVGLGLLLDADMIPVNMVLYPGNESEKQYLRQSMDKLRMMTGSVKRTIQVADKGLNCARNIYEAMGCGNGYIFSKSVKTLDKNEKAWVFEADKDSWVKAPSGEYYYKECVDTFSYEFEDEDGLPVSFFAREKRIATFNPKLRTKQKAEVDRLVEKARRSCLSQAKKSEFGDCGKFIRFVAKDGSERKPSPVLNMEAIDKAYMYCGYNMLVTSETDKDSTDIYRIYHNLWRIEETFRAMKTGLDTRPVYLQKENSIKGHFLICYLAILLTRLIQFKDLDNEFCTNEIINFMRDFIVVEDPNGKDYMNIGRYSKIYDRYNEKYGIMLHLFKLKQRDFKTLGL